MSLQKDVNACWENLISSEFYRIRAAEKEQHFLGIQYRFQVCRRIIDGLQHFVVSFSID